MTHRFLFGLTFFILTLIQSCVSQSGDNSNGETELINKNAPFYTHELPEGHPRISKQFDSAKIESFWPFIIYNDNSYMVAANLNSDTTLDKIGTFFEKYESDGTGYNWAALIKLILKKENPELLKHIDFDPEGNALYLFADSETNQRRFAGFMSKTFQDTAKLTSYLTGPDKEEAMEFNPNK